MRVLLDATAVPPDRGGVGRYVDELVPALVRAGMDLAVVCQARDEEAYSRLAPSAPVVVGPPAIGRRPARLAWEQTVLPRLVRRLRADVLHSPHYTMPVRSPVPVVVTVHDATFFSDLHLHSAVKGRFFRNATRWAARHSAGLVVPSQATADELARFVRTITAPVTVAHHGVDLDFYTPASQAEQQRVRTSLGLGDRPFVGFLGTLEPRKNLPALVRAWTTVAGRSPEAERPTLVLAGGRGWDTELDAAVDAVPAGLTVLRPGYLPLGDLPAFLTAATVVTYPSLGEGFGLPVLEAMACGAAVLTTRRLSLPEVGGDAVAYCDVTDTDIASVLSDLLADPARRQVLSEAARARAAQFTWDASAASHLAAYRAATAGGDAFRPRC